MKKYVGNFVAGVFVIGFILLNSKSCVIQPWHRPEAGAIFSLDGEGKRGIMMVFVSDLLVMFWYTDGKGSMEGTLNEVRGNLATNYFWNIWRIEGPYVWWPLRIYPSHLKPVNAEIKTLQKVIHSPEKGFNPVFQSKGDTTYTTLLVGDNVVEFHGMTLKREKDNPELVSKLFSSFIPETK